MEAYVFQVYCRMSNDWGWACIPAPKVRELRPFSS